MGIKSYKSLVSRQIKLIAFTSLIAAFSGTANAVWTDVSPLSGFVVDFTLAPSAPATIFATSTGANGTEFGVWRSTNSGTAWTQVSNSTPYEGAAVRPDSATIVLAGVRSGVVENSTTSGDIGTWGVTAGSASHMSWVFGFSTSIPSTVYAGGFTVNGNGIMQKSTNSGASWVPLTIDGDATPSITAIAVDPTNANIVYAAAQPTGGNNDGVYKSINGGASWACLTCTIFTLVRALAVDPNDPLLIYAGATGFGLIMRSIDGGISWTTIHDPNSGGVAGFTRFAGIAINPNDSTVIYAVGGSGTTKVIVSTNCGTSWSEVASTGIGLGQPSRILIDTINSFIYVVETIFSNSIYQEALIPAGIGDCPAGMANGGGAGGGGAGGGGGGGGPFGYLVLVLMTFLGFFRFRFDKSGK